MWECWNFCGESLRHGFRGTFGNVGLKKLEEIYKASLGQDLGASLHPASSSVDFLLVSLEVYFKVINLGFFLFYLLN